MFGAVLHKEIGSLDHEKDRSKKVGNLDFSKGVHGFSQI